MLKPFLSRIEDFIDKSIAVKDATFDKYFKLMDYLDHFECYGKQHHEFAKALVVSSQFVHFCDDYFAEVDHNNFKMLKEIFMSRGEPIQMTDEAKYK
jgi:predicted metal-binding protein